MRSVKQFSVVEVLPKIFQTHLKRLFSKHCLLLILQQLIKTDTRNTQRESNHLLSHAI